MEKDITIPSMKLVESFRSNDLPRINEHIKHLTGSIGPVLKIIQEAQARFTPLLPIIQSAIEQRSVLSQFIQPEENYFTPSLVIAAQEPALTHSDIPEITEAVADKLTRKLKLANKPRYRASTPITILFQKNALFLSTDLDNKYEFRAAPKRLEILTLLINAGEEFTSTDDIRKFAGSANNATVRKELKTLDKIICDTLGLKISIIDNIPGTGYRINPMYKIRIKN